MTTKEKLQICVDALAEITEAKGAYSMDRLEHASNTIRDMSECAKQALSNIGYYGYNHIFKDN